MAPLFVQGIAWVALWLIGRQGLFGALASGTDALRFSLAVMFVFTGVSHFIPRTQDAFIRMVPRSLPAPRALVIVTGVLQVAGAVGLCLGATMRPAAFCLAVLLLVMAPANVRAGREGVEIAGRRAMPIALRLPLQAFWIACLVYVGYVAP